MPIVSGSTKGSNALFPSAMPSTALNTEIAGVSMPVAVEQCKPDARRQGRAEI